MRKVALNLLNAMAINVDIRHKTLYNSHPMPRSRLGELDENKLFHNINNMTTPWHNNPYPEGHENIKFGIFNYQFWSSIREKERNQIFQHLNVAIASLTLLLSQEKTIDVLSLECLTRSNS